MYNPDDKVKLIRNLTYRILDKGITRNKQIAEEIARRWVTKREMMTSEIQLKDKI